MHLLNQVYEANTAREPWQAGDLMLVDNIRTAHSREAFAGERDVLVAMANPYHATRLTSEVNSANDAPVGRL